MTPALTIDNEPDFTFPTEQTTAPAKANEQLRTLLLAPPSVASHPEALQRVAEAYDRNVTEIQMLDRLAVGLVTLPAATYDIVLLLTDVDGSRTESSRLLNREVMSKVVESLKEGGKLRSQDGAFGVQQGPEFNEAILAGLVQSDENDGMRKSESTGAVHTVGLNFGKKRANAAAVPANAVETANLGKRKSEDIFTGSVPLPQSSGNGSGPAKVTPAGVGFVGLDDDFGDAYKDDEEIEFPSQEELDRAERIDPDTLLTKEDMQRPIIVPEACKPNTKRRRACKDCTCGLAERLAAEDKEKRDNADANLAKLSVNDLTEVDFTVKGKIGSCGNCALGDAFRCDGCPYIGLPAFKPGEEVRLLNNEVQL